VNQGDIILVGKRDYQDAKADVILRYNAEEARNLKAYGELPETAKINETDTFDGGEDEIPFEFADTIGGPGAAESSDESGDEIDLDAL